MDNLTEQEPEIVCHPLSYWILIAVRVNVVWYMSLLIFNLVSDLQSSDEAVTWQSILLATSPNWHSFLNAWVFMLVFSLFVAVAAWKLEPYWQRKNP